MENAADKVKEKEKEEEQKEEEEEKPKQSQGAFEKWANGVYVCVCVWFGANGVCVVLG